MAFFQRSQLQYAWGCNGWSGTWVFILADSRFPTVGLVQPSSKFPCLESDRYKTCLTHTQPISLSLLPSIPTPATPAGLLSVSQARYSVYTWSAKEGPRRKPWMRSRCYHDNSSMNPHHCIDDRQDKRPQMGIREDQSPLYTEHHVSMMVSQFIQTTS